MLLEDDWDDAFHEDHEEEDEDGFGEDSEDHEEDEHEDEEDEPTSFDEDSCYEDFQPEVLSSESSYAASRHLALGVDLEAFLFGVELAWVLIFKYLHAMFNNL